MWCACSTNLLLIPPPPPKKKKEYAPRPGKVPPTNRPLLILVDLHQYLPMRTPNGNNHPTLLHELLHERRGDALHGRAKVNGIVGSYPSFTNYEEKE
jgi:hypothetical protein